MLRSDLSSSSRTFNVRLICSGVGGGSAVKKHAVAVAVLYSIGKEEEYIE